MAVLKNHADLYKIETSVPFYDLGSTLFAKKARYEHRGRKKKYDPYEKMKKYWDTKDGCKDK